MNNINYLDPIYGSSTASTILEKNNFPEDQQDPRTVLELITNELDLDGNARQNLATFCQTWDSKEVRTLMDMAIGKNMIDKDEYPQSAEIENRCWHMLADLWNADSKEDPIGTSTVGSSEACFLGGLAMFFRWKQARKIAGKPYDKPNLVCGPVQIVWEKFCRYWDIEIRQIPMEENRLYMDSQSMLSMIDENTIGVVTTLGLTFTGKYEPVEQLANALDRLQETTGLDVKLHIDAASGGFLAPFCAPELPWDFRLKRVVSISASGHKFGLAPLGCGWVLWRGRSFLPDALVFNVNYLGGDMPVFQINFSRSAGPIISQYYLFTRLGKEGYKKIHSLCYDTGKWIANELDKFGIFDFVYISDPKDGIPAVTWKLKKDANLPFTLYDLADKLRIKGWQVPAYSLPEHVENIVVQRILVRQGFTQDMATMLIEDFDKAIKTLSKNPVKPQKEISKAFAHN